MGNVFGSTASYGYGTKKNRRTPAQIRANLVERQRLMCSGRDQNSIDHDATTKKQYEDFSKVPTRQWVNNRFATARNYNLPRNVRGQYVNLVTESERKQWRERYLSGLRESMTEGARDMKRWCAELTKELADPKLAPKPSKLAPKRVAPKRVARRTKRATTSRRR